MHILGTNDAGTFDSGGLSTNRIIRTMAPPVSSQSTEATRNSESAAISGVVLHSLPLVVPCLLLACWSKSVRLAKFSKTKSFHTNGSIRRNEELDQEPDVKPVHFILPLARMPLFIMGDNSIGSF